MKNAEEMMKQVVARLGLDEFSNTYYDIMTPACSLDEKILELENEIERLKKKTFGLTKLK